MTLSNHRNVLFISYLFPPIGGAGVQRSLKFVKYLPQCGWKPFVLTVKDITHYAYDGSLLSDLPSETTIIRTESVDPLRVSASFWGLGAKSAEYAEKGTYNPQFGHGSRKVRIGQKVRDYFAFPDVAFGWIPFAYRAGLRAIRDSNISAIVVALGHYSSSIVGYLLSKRTHIPYLLDVRDGWTDDPFLVRPTPLHRWGHAALEQLIVGSANYVVAYGPEQARLFLERYPQLAGRVDTIYNGFDPADFSNVTPKQRPLGRYRIVYVGTLYKYFEANIGFFIEALKLVPADLAQKIEIVFVGQVYDQLVEQFSAANLDVRIEYAGYVPHGDALGYLASADAGLLFLVPGSLHGYTGKVFEYLVTGIPILACIEPDAMLAPVLLKAGQGDWIAKPSDPEDIAKCIVRLANAGWPKPERSNLEVFDRRQNTKRLAAILDRLDAD